MHAVMGNRTIGAGEHDEQNRLRHEEIVPLVKSQPGFVSGYWMHDPETGKSHTAIICDIAGPITVVAAIPAWRGRRVRLLLDVASQAVSALLSIPLYFADATPNWACTVVAIAIAVSLLGIGLLAPLHQPSIEISSWARSEPFQVMVRHVPWRNDS